MSGSMGGHYAGGGRKPSSQSTRRSPEAECALRIPQLGSPPGLHLAQAPPPDRPIEQSNVPPFRTDVCRGLAERFRMLGEIRVVAHLRTAGAVRGEDALEARAKNVQVCHE